MPREVSALNQRGATLWTGESGSNDESLYVLQNDASLLCYMFGLKIYFAYTPDLNNIHEGKRGNSMFTLGL